MIQVLVRHHVKKYEDFEAVFLGGRERRRRLGSKGGTVFREIGDGDDVVILLEWEDEEKAREWLDSFESREAVEWATAGAKPEILLMDDVLAVES